MTSRGRTARLGPRESKLGARLLKRREDARSSIATIVLRALGAMLGLQAATIAILQIVTEVRKLRRGAGEFPHPELAPVHVGENTLRIYAYGQDLYEAMLAAIDGARESIYLETFIWKGDEVGQEFKDHLARKASEGVDVYVVFDSFGNLVVPAAFKAFPADVHAMGFHGIKRPWQVIDPRRYALEHRKLLVVDGRTGFIGGYNLGTPYATTWRDTHLRLEGPGAADLAQEFADLWNANGAPAQRISRHYPRPFDPRIHVQGTSAVRLTFPIRNMYIEAIDNAERSIAVTSAYFAPDSVLLDALKSAAERGVEVRVLVPWVSNHVVADWLARGYFTQCLQAGIRVFCYRRMLHAKTCTIDGQWTTIGTANLDRLSSVGNYEINAEIYSEALARQMGQLFEVDTTCAFELKLDEWLRRPWYAKLGEIILEPLRAIM